MIETLLTLFFMFFKIGLFTFGGGYAMIPLIRAEVVGGGYISEQLLIDFIGISESTPGPFAVNMATFIGTNQAGVLGGLFATLGVVLPSFLIIFLIARFGAKILETKTMKHAFVGLKPAVVGLVLSVAITLILGAMIPSIRLKPLVFDISLIDMKAFLIMLVVFVLLRTTKKATPIKMIGLSAVLGLLFYGLL
jgi:chromate transporter